MYNLGIICMEDRGGMYHYFSHVLSLVRSLPNVKTEVILLTTTNEVKKPVLCSKILHNDFKIYRILVPSQRVWLYKVFSQKIDRIVQTIIDESSTRIWLILWDSYFLNSVNFGDKRVFLIVHDVFPHESAGLGKLASTVLHHRSLQNRAKADTLITNSQCQFMELQTLYPNKEKVYLPMPPMLTQEIIYGNKEPDEVRSIDNYFLFFGRIELYKGLENLIRAFSLYQGKRYLVIAGKGKIRVKIDSMIKQRVLLINRYIDDCEIKRLFEKACCIIFPYISATQVGPLSIAHYFAKPLIIPAIWPFLEKFDFTKPEGIVVSKNDVESLVYALNTIDDDEVRKIFEENCRGAFQKHYSTQEFRDFLAKIVGVRN